MPRTVASDDETTRWHLVVDNLKRHHSAGLVPCVAEHDGITEDRGQQDTRGMLQSMATRAALLADPSHRMVFHYTPQQASWRHPMAMGCSLLVRQLLQRASFTSAADLQPQVLAFVDYCNATMAKPFQWTYGQKPLHV
jgi:putative transposase